MKKLLPLQMLDGWVSLPEAAKLADVTERWMRQLIADGKVLGVQVGRNYLVHRASALKFKRHPTAGRPRQD